MTDLSTTSQELRQAANELMQSSKQHLATAERYLQAADLLDGGKTLPALRPTEARVLGALNGHPLRIKAIARDAQTTYGSATFYLGALRKRGMVTRIARGLYQRCPA